MSIVRKIDPSFETQGTTVKRDFELPVFAISTDFLFVISSVHVEVMSIQQGTSFMFSVSSAPIVRVASHTLM